MANKTLPALPKISPEALKVLASVIQSRADLSQRMGQQFNGNRDIYVSCGFPKTLSTDDFAVKYERMGIASRVVRAYPEATWRGQPSVYETEKDEETDFEKAWNSLVAKRHIWSYLSRVDKLAGIGQYAILLLGVNDGKSLDQPLVKKKGQQLIYLQPYSQADAVIDSYETEKDNERFDLPTMYSVTVRRGTLIGAKVQSNQGVGVSRKVHWTRVIHVAEGCETSDIFGESRLQKIFNDLLSLEKIMGVSGEGFWQTCFGGLSFEADASVDLDQTGKALSEEIDAYVHGLQRYMKLQGVTAKPISTNMQDPTPFVNAAIQMISAGTGIPQRILTGSERGELASTQDRENWGSRVDERRKEFAEPFILRAFVYRLVELGVLPDTKDHDEADAPKFLVDWPEIGEVSKKEQADIGKVKIDTCAAYINGGVDAMITPQRFLEEYMGMTADEAEEVLQEAEQRMTDQEQANIDMADMGLNPDGSLQQPAGDLQNQNPGDSTDSNGASVGELVDSNGDPIQR